MKKTFTKQEIRDLFNQVMHEEISFSRMVKVINHRISEEEKPNFKEGDFLHSDWGGENITIIFRKVNGSHLYYHVSKSNSTGLGFGEYKFWPNDGDFRLATESEKKELIDALAKEGKLWNAEKLVIEDIPEELKEGDLAIFWNFNAGTAMIGEYDYSLKDDHYPHKDKMGNIWANAIKFESKEQFEKLIRGEK